MAAIIGLDDSVIVDICDQAAVSDVVSAVNFNSPVSGDCRQYGGC